MQHSARPHHVHAHARLLPVEPLGFRRHTCRFAIRAQATSYSEFMCQRASSDSLNLLDAPSHDMSTRYCWRLRRVERHGCVEDCIIRDRAHHTTWARSRKMYLQSQRHSTVSRPLSRPQQCKSPATVFPGVMTGGRHVGRALPP